MEPQPGVMVTDPRSRKSDVFSFAASSGASIVLVGNAYFG